MLKQRKMQLMLKQHKTQLMLKQRKMQLMLKQRKMQKQAMKIQALNVLFQLKEYVLITLHYLTDVVLLTTTQIYNKIITSVQDFTIATL